MRDLILNADDFGLTSGVNQGIIQAHREGILSSATLMANGPAFEDAVARAHQNPSLGVGVHLVLVGGRPVAPPELIASLLDGGGNLPRGLPALVAGVTAGLIRPEHMQKELRAQIEKVRAAGIEPTHLDTHKHTHAHPRVMESVAHVARDCGIARIRRPFENLRDSWNFARGQRVASATQLASATVARLASGAFDAICRKYRLQTPSRFLGLALTGRISAAVLRAMIDTVSEGTTEIMLHPGICDPQLGQTGSRLQVQRQTELAALLAPEPRGTLAQRDIRLITYREVR